MDTETVNDEELLMLINEDTEEAKDLIFNLHKNIIDIFLAKYNKIFYKLGIDMQEAYAEGLYGFSDAIKSYNSNKSASFKTFLSLCIKRRLIKVIRKYNTDKSRFDNSLYSLDYIYDDLGFSLVETVCDEVNDDPLNKLTEKENYELLNSMIKEKLSELEYEVYEYLVEGLNYQEIAILIDKNAKQVDNAIQRIKVKVKEIIDNIK